MAGVPIGPTAGPESRRLPTRPDPSRHRSGVQPGDAPRSAPQTPGTTTVIIESELLAGK